MKNHIDQQKILSVGQLGVYHHEYLKITQYQTGQFCKKCFSLHTDELIQKDVQIKLLQEQLQKALEQLQFMNILTQSDSFSSKTSSKTSNKSTPNYLSKQTVSTQRARDTQLSKKSTTYQDISKSESQLSNLEIVDFITGLNDQQYNHSSSQLQFQKYIVEKQDKEIQCVSKQTDFTQSYTFTIEFESKQTQIYTSDANYLQQIKIYSDQVIQLEKDNSNMQTNLMLQLGNQRVKYENIFKIMNEELEILRAEKLKYETLTKQLDQIFPSGNYILDIKQLITDKEIVTDKFIVTDSIKDAILIEKAQLIQNNTNLLYQLELEQQEYSKLKTNYDFSTKQNVIFTNEIQGLYLEIESFKELQQTHQQNKIMNKTIKRQQLEINEFQKQIILLESWKKENQIDLRDAIEQKNNIIQDLIYQINSLNQKTVKSVFNERWKVQERVKNNVFPNTFFLYDSIKYIIKLNKMQIYFYRKKQMK